MTQKELKQSIIQSGLKAVEELIRVAEEKIITHTEDDVSAYRLKNAAATKKLAIFDAFEILTRLKKKKQCLKTNQKNQKKNLLKVLQKGGLSNGLPANII